MVSDQPFPTAQRNDTMVMIPVVQWERIAAVVRAAVTYHGVDAGIHHAVDALTPEDIEAVQP